MHVKNLKVTSKKEIKCINFKQRKNELKALVNSKEDSKRKQTNKEIEEK